LRYCFVFFILSYNFPETIASEGLPVHNVNTSKDYATIQDAINAAETLDGHTIMVNSGVYHESIVINKSISLEAQDEDIPTIDGGGTITVITITADHVTISGFNIRNGQAGTAILLDNSLNCCFCNNNLRDAWFGVVLRESNYTSLIKNNIVSSSYCVLLSSSTNNAIVGNNITTLDGQGISLSGGSSNNSIVGNTVTGSKRAGIYLASCQYNLVAENNLFNNSYALYLTDSSNNTIYHNNCVSTVLDIFIRNILNYTTNIWDNGYPSGGNYYSNYAGGDRHGGPYQNETGGDGIGDVSYKIESDTQDNYPLMGVYHSFNVTSMYNVQIISNSTISNLNYNGTAVSFYISGDDGSIGFCRICIPTVLINGTYQVFINGTKIVYNLLSCTNSTHSYLYFIYNHSTQSVVIVPEFSHVLFILVFLVGISTIKIYKRGNYSC